VPDTRRHELGDQRSGMVGGRVHDGDPASADPPAEDSMYAEKRRWPAALNPV
jgi:hypothetical protein